MTTNPPTPRHLDRQRAAAQLKRRAEELINLPVLETETADGTIVKPINSAHLSGAAKALEIAYQLEDHEPAQKPEPVQLAFGFDLAPQTDGGKLPWSKRIQVEGFDCYLNIRDDLLANPPGWETQFWLDHPARKREWPKKALYIAWACSPAYSRQPRTQKEVAALLGVTPVAICLWKSKNPEMIKEIQERTLEPLEQALADVYRVTIDQARDPNGSVQARKLYFEALSDARNARLPMNPAQMVQLIQNFVSNINWQNLAPEQMDRIAAGEHPLLVLAANVGAEAGASPMVGTPAEVR